MMRICIFPLHCCTLYSVSSDSIVKGIIDDIINTAVKTAEIDEQKTKYLQHFITFGTPRMYTLSLSKSIKRSNYGEFLKVKNVLFMYTMYYRQQRTSTL
jgi:hypothetical protein